MRIPVPCPSSTGLCARKTRDLEFVDAREVAELQTLLEGVDLPAEKRELVRYAAALSGTPTQLRLLGGLAQDEYGTIDEVGEELFPGQPVRADEVPHQPREESGAPPGGDEYTNPA